MNNSRKAKYVFQDGRIYEGEFVNNLPDGVGKMTFANHDTYEGHWDKGNMQNHGTYRFFSVKHDKFRGYYEGEFKDSMFSGLGKMVYPDKSEYCGLWQNGKKNGYGQFVMPFGDTIVGFWLNDEICEGTYIFEDGSKFVGKFVNGKFDGFGTFFSINGAILQGEWKQNKLINGYQYLPNGDMAPVKDNTVIITSYE